MRSVFHFTRSHSRVAAYGRSFSSSINASSSNLRERLANLANESVTNNVTVLESNNQAKDQAQIVHHAFDKYFNQTKNQYTSLHDIRSGSHVSVASSDLEKYLPEGLAGDFKDEFNFIMEQQQWMVRDSTKLVIKLIEEWEKNLKGTSSKNSENSNKALESVININNLTDRTEWENSQLKCFHFGKNLINEDLQRNQGDDSSHPGFVSINGETSFTSQAVNFIKNSHGGKLPSKLLLGGNRGVGKSVILNQAVMEARKRGWVVVFIPNGWEHVQSGDYVDPVPQEFYSYQSFNKDKQLYDNPMMSTVALRNLWKAHREQLGNMPIKFSENVKKYQSFIEDFQSRWSKAKSVFDKNKKATFINMRAVVDDEDHIEEMDALDEPLLSTFDVDSFKFKTLEDLLVFGVAFMESSGSVFIDLMHELRNQEQYPLLIAVDQYNCWEDETAFRYDYRPVPGKDICVPNALSFLSLYKSKTADWGDVKNGICIAATSFKHTSGKKYDYEQYKSSIPLFIKVPSYNQIEFLSKVSHYLNFSPMQLDVDTNQLLGFRTFTGSRGDVARKEFVSFFMPELMEQTADEITTAILIGDRGDIDNLDAEGVEAEGVETAGEAVAMEGEMEEFLYYTENEDQDNLDDTDVLETNAKTSSKGSKGAKGGKPQAKGGKRK